MALVACDNFFKLNSLILISIFSLSGCGGGGGENVIADNDDNNVIANLDYSSYEDGNALYMDNNDHIGQKYVLPSISVYADISYDFGDDEAARSVDTSSITSKTAAIEYSYNEDEDDSNYLIDIIDTDAEKTLSFSTVLAEEPNSTTDWDYGVSGNYVVSGDLGYVWIEDIPDSVGTDKTVVFSNPNERFDYQIFGIWQESNEIDNIDVGLFSSGMRTDIIEIEELREDGYRESAYYSDSNNAIGSWVDDQGKIWSVYGQFDAMVDFHGSDTPTMDMSIDVKTAVDDNGKPALIELSNLDVYSSPGEYHNPLRYNSNTGMFEGAVRMDSESIYSYEGNAAATFYGPANGSLPEELGGVTTLLRGDDEESLESLSFSFGARKMIN